MRNNLSHNNSSVPGKFETGKIRISSVGIIKKRPRRVSNSDSHSNVCGYSITIQNPTPEGVEFW